MNKLVLKGLCLVFGAMCFATGTSAQDNALISAEMMSLAQAEIRQMSEAELRSMTGILVDWTPLD